MLSYLKDHILEEISGANEYMQKAVEHKGTVCGEKFNAMAKMETEHANTLYAMFREQEKPITMSDADYAKMLKDILDKFADGMAKFESLKRLYYM